MSLSRYVNNTIEILITHRSDIASIFVFAFTFALCERTLSPIQTVPACPIQIRAHHHIAVYIDSNYKEHVIWKFFSPSHSDH